MQLGEVMGVPRILVDSVESLQEMMFELDRMDEASYDTETTSLDYLSCELLGLNFGNGVKAWYVPIAHDPWITNTDQLAIVIDQIVEDAVSIKRSALSTGSNYDVLKQCKSREEVLSLLRSWFRNGELGSDFEKVFKFGWNAPRMMVLDWLKPYLEKADRTFRGQNFKYDYQVTKCTTGITIGGHWRDTMVEAWLVDENRRVGLKKLSKQLFDYDQGEYANVGGKEVSYKNAWLADAATYGCDDAAITWMVHDALYPDMVAQGLDQVYVNVEARMVRVLADMELEGVPIDVPFLQKFGEYLTIEIKKASDKVIELAGYEFNIGSGKQLAKVLFEEKGYPILALTGKGAPKTDSATMASLASQGYEIAVHIDRYKKLSKLKSTYVEGLLMRIGKDGKLHGSFNQTGTHTGRLSSSDPK